MRKSGMHISPLLRGALSSIEMTKSLLTYFNSPTMSVFKP